MTSVQQLRQQNFSELACQFAAYIDRQESAQQPWVTLAAALLSEAVAAGHVCLNLSELPALCQPFQADLPVDIKQWRTGLLAGQTVGEPGDYAPLILTPENRLYLYRYWFDEQMVASQIQQRLQPVAVDLQQLQQALQQWPSNVPGTDWQKVAVAVAMTRQFAVISGGPGTGKTTIVRHILHNLLQQLPDCRIALAAPTGKAAARLQQSLAGAFSLDVKTLHRLLGITEFNDQGRYHAERPLPWDVLIVDEASMIDIALMAKLLRALPMQARLILLGDSQQLASVESGAVLAHLSAAAQGAFSDDFRTWFPAFDLPAAEQADTWLTDSFVRLQHSYRFSADSQIGQWAESVNQGAADTLIEQLQQAASGIWFDSSETAQREVLLQGYQAFIAAVEQAEPAAQILQAFDQFRVLAALRQGPQSVASVNRLMSQLLLTRGWRTTQAFYAGRPIMITHNDYRQQLFNGDTGVIVPDASGQLSACFCFDDTLRRVAINRLPAHETAFAMTVHKSQGSEFDQIAVLLPGEDTPLLTRELVYTALTRARDAVVWLSPEAILRQAVLRRHQRESGLSDLLQQR